MIVPSPSRLATGSTSSLSSHALLVRDLVRLAMRRLITIYEHGPHTLVAITDAAIGEDDWFMVGACGHVSTGHVHRTEAEQWRCPVCDEQRLSERNISDLTARLQFVALHASNDKSVHAANSTHSSFHGDVA